MQTLSIRVSTTAILIAALLTVGGIAVPVSADPANIDLETHDDEYEYGDGDPLTISVQMSTTANDYELWVDHNNNGTLDNPIKEDEEPIKITSDQEEYTINLEGYVSQYDVENIGDEEDLVQVGIVDATDGTVEEVLETEYAWLEETDWSSPHGIHWTSDGSINPFESALENLFLFGFNLTLFAGFTIAFAGVILWFGLIESSKYSQIGMYLTAGGMILIILYYAFDTLVELLCAISS